MNKTYIFAAVGFVAGVASGIGATYLYFKKLHEEKLAKEVASLKEVYGRQSKNHSSNDEQKSTDISENEELKKESKKLSDALGYSGSESELSVTLNKNHDYTTHFDEKEIDEEFPEDEKNDYIDLPADDPYRPRVISDVEYYDEPDMEKIEINLFEGPEPTDYVLTDTSWEPLEEPYKVIVKDDLIAFINQNEEDEIFTICEGRNCMYSIMKQGQSWETFLKNNPVIVETRY